MFAKVKKAVCAILFFSFVCTGCGEEKTENTVTTEETQTTSASQETAKSETEILKPEKSYDKDSDVTLMIYMIGSDLESEDGSATNDLNEILYSDADDLNITLQTGGTTEWQNTVIEGGVVQRHTIRNGEFETVKTLGDISMGDEDTLADFIKWSAREYPADRYMLLFWDHGGGTMCGFGQDDMHGGEGLMLSQIGSALEKGGVKFDIVGFDSCLMCTLETAYMLHPYADYLLASEETEPECGWYYTDWIKALSDDHGIDSVELGRMIVDDFVDNPDAEIYDARTLSLIDLAEMPGLYDKITKYMNNSIVLLDESYSKVSKARSNAKSFGDNEFDQIDIMSYINAMEDVKGKNELKASLSDAVRYTNSFSCPGATGLAMYYPYLMPEYYSDTTTDMEGYSYDGYEAFYDKFLNIMTAGQLAAERDPSFSSIYDTEDYDVYSYSWYDEDYAEDYGELADYGELEIIDKGDYYALSLTDEDWESITDVALCVWIDDGEGIIDLGRDNVYEFDDDGDLKVDFDYTWVALDGQFAPFYLESAELDDDGDLVSTGYIPATLNDSEDIEIIVYWGTGCSTGNVIGYRLANTDNRIEMMQKGLRQFKDGDYLDFSCDYYTYDGEFDGVYSFGEGITVNGEIEVSYEDIGDQDTLIYYQLTDIYNNTYDTESVSISA